MLVPGSAMATGWDADDNGCPDPDQMELLVSGTGLALAPIEIPTSQNMPELDGDDCGSSPLPTWCRSSFGYHPPGLIDSSLNPYPREELLVWLVGGGNWPDQMHMIPQTAAYAGYRTINLSWDNDGDNFEIRCEQGLDGKCDDNCIFDVVTEFLTGIDVPAAPGDTDDTYTPHPMHSIEGKLKLALEHMHVRDINRNGTPQEHWDDFCTQTDLEWEMIEVAGFSMGAQLASYITYMEPGNDPDNSSIGFMGVDLGVPACEYYPSLGNGDPTDDHFPALMTDHTTMPPCGEDVTGACPNENRFVVIHEAGFLYDPDRSWAGGELLMDLVDLGFPEEGVSYPPQSIDAAIQGSTLLDAAGRIDQASYGNLLETDFTTGDNPITGDPWGAHASMAEDSKLVVDRTSKAFASNAGEYYLLPVYLEAFCELSE